MLVNHIVAGRVLDDEEYVEAVQGASVAIGLVSEQNADEHTNRSVEIPAIGTLLCAARTPQHLQLYVEDAEAVFWRDADECIGKCRALLADPSRRAAVAAAGHARMIASRNWNEQLMRRVLAVASVPDEKRGERLVVLHLAHLSSPPCHLCRGLSELGLPNLWVPGERDFFPVPNLPTRS